MKYNTKILLGILSFLLSFNSFTQIAKFKANWFGTKEIVDDGLQPDKVSILITLNIEENELIIYTPDIQKYELMLLKTAEENKGTSQYFQAIDKYGNLCWILIVHSENFKKRGEYTFFIQYKDKINDIYWWYWADIIDYEE